jgi:hypothetical protein
MALDFEEVQRRKLPATDECQIILDPVAAKAVSVAEAARDAAKSMATLLDNNELNGELLDAEEGLREAQESATEAAVTFRFRAIGRVELDHLMGEHPPTKEQTTTARREGKGAPMWDGDTFPPALIAACCVEPAIDDKQAAEMWTSPQWNAGELDALFMCAWLLCRQRKVVDLGKGSGQTTS